MSERIDIADVPWCDNGLELEPPLAEGFSVYSGCEGDDPHFLGFFMNEQDAEAFAALHQYGDVHHFRALLTEHGIVTENDFEIESHTQLIARYRKALSLAKVKPHDG